MIFVSIAGAVILLVAAFLVYCAYAANEAAAKRRSWPSDGREAVPDARISVPDNRKPIAPSAP